MSAENDAEKAALKEDLEVNMPPNEADPPAASNAAAKMDPETEPLNAAANPKVEFKSGSENVDVEKGSGDKNKQELAPALTKSELMKYATDPFWVKLRWALFIGFWLIWVGMLVSAVVIIIYAEKCPSPAPKQWWQKKPVYEVFVKSFKDSNGDGVGDLKGVESKLDYLSHLGVGSIYLSPVFKSPDKDNGFDVSDYKAIDPRYGTLEDFKALLAAIHEKGMKLIIDFIPNQTSDQHEWFQKSIANEEPYNDYYVWADGKGGGAPSNWKTILDETKSAWTKNSQRGQYYLHQFSAEQPDLNLRNPKVVEELEGVLKFWVGLGVDGFRVDSVGNFFEDADLGNNDDLKTMKNTFNLPGDEVLELLKKFRTILDDETKKDEDNPRIMMTEAYMKTKDIVRYYGKVDNQTGIGSISHLPLNFALMQASLSPLTASDLKTVVDGYLEDLNTTTQTTPWPNFCTGNHDHSRVASRLGDSFVDIMNMVTLMLPGTSFTYYGEEIGMVDGASTGSDPRRAYQTPMQWTSGANAGFSDATPAFAQVNAGYETLNVETLEGVENSHTHVYREVASLRETETILFGSTKIVVEDTVFTLTRIRKGNPGYLLVSNFGNGEVTIEGLPEKVQHLAQRGTLTLGVPRDENVPIGTQLDLTSLVIPPNQSYLITFVPNFA